MAHKRESFPIVAFRVTPEMREEAKIVAREKGWTTIGEFYRSILRKEIKEHREQSKT